MKTGIVRRFYPIVLLLSQLIGAATGPQAPSPAGSHQLVLMCLSAHPDDEDGLALVYYNRLRHVKTYSILFTRGEGGQNEIGSELDADLGRLRTKETLEASRILGSEIHFLGFTDFGFSKTAKETFARWGGRDSVLARLVYVIRALKPDVIITNHDTVTTLPYRQHGNHQVVGLTAFEAFKKAVDSTYHPEQFRDPNIQPWQVKKLYMRSSGRDTLTPLVHIDPSDTDAAGKSMESYALAALARHRSQGMDKVVAHGIPHRWLQHWYRLMESDRTYPFDSLNFFSGIQPEARPIALLPSTTSDTTLPVSFSIDPQYSVLERPDESKRTTIKRIITVSFKNNDSSDFPVDLSVSLGHQKLFYKTYHLRPGPSTDKLRLSFQKPSRSTKEVIRLEAIPADQGVSSPIPGAAFTLVPVRADFPKTLSIGLVETYDKYTEDFLNSFNIPFTLLDSAKLAKGKLDAYTTIILDLRTYFYRSDALKYNSRLMEYVRRGGNIVCLYHKPADWNQGNYAPYPLHLTSDRVTEEDAPVEVLIPRHPFFQTPNTISQTDWTGWVQERNIYLPSDDTAETSSAYLRLLGMSDENEHEPPTSLLWARYGKGTYTYVALALYRQVRIMHQGAVKLFINLISQPRQAQWSPDGR